MNKAVIEKLDTFFSSYPTHTFKKGEIILDANESPKGVFYIEEGVIRRYFLSEKGEEITLNLHKVHSFLPMSWALANIPNIHFYEAMTPVTIRRAPKEIFLAFLRKEPDILYDLLQRVYVGMEGMWQHIESLSNGNSYMKLVTSLVTLTKRFGKEQKDGIFINLKLTETDLANVAGMARETASRELQKLKQQHIVSYDKGYITVYNLKKLEDLMMSEI